MKVTARPCQSRRAQTWATAMPAPGACRTSRSGSHAKPRRHGCRSTRTGGESRGSSGPALRPAAQAGSFGPEVWRPVSQLLALKVGGCELWVCVPSRPRTGSVVLQGDSLGGVMVTSVQARPCPHVASPPPGGPVSFEELFRCRCRARCPEQR